MTDREKQLIEVGWKAGWVAACMKLSDLLRKAGAPEEVHETLQILASKPAPVEITTCAPSTERVQ